MKFIKLLIVCALAGFVAGCQTLASKNSTGVVVARRAQIHSSTAVVLRCTSGLAGFMNCCGMNAFGSSDTIWFALSIAPRMPFAPSVRTSFAPRPRSVMRRSWLIVSGITSTHL